MLKMFCSPKQRPVLRAKAFHLHPESEGQRRERMCHEEGGRQPFTRGLSREAPGSSLIFMKLPGSLKLICPPAKRLSRRSEALNGEALPHLSFCSEFTLQETFVCCSPAQPLGFPLEHVRRGLKFESQPVGEESGAHPLPCFAILIAEAVHGHPFTTCSPRQVSLSLQDSFGDILNQIH